VYSIRTRKKNYNITVILRITELEQTMALTQEELLHLAHWDLNEAQTKRRLLALKINDLLKEAEPTVAQRNTASKLIMEKNHDR
jgi:hypothetical protein